jgi:hypothetical protein
MRWYLKVNENEICVTEAMEALEDIKAKGWQDYLMLPGNMGFNILRGLEEHLSDPDHPSGLYSILNGSGKRPTRPKVNITGYMATFKGLIVVWSPEAKVSNFYYREDSDLDIVSKFGLKDPILIKCST